MLVKHSERGVFPRIKLAMGQNFRGCYLSPLYSLQALQSLASRISGFGVKRRLGATGPRPLPGGKGVTRQKNGKC